MIRSPSRLTITAVVAALAFGICYGGVIASLLEVWSTDYLYSYGFAVPFIAAYIFWTRSDESRTLVAAPDYAFGVPVTLLGIAILLVGRLGALTGLEQASLVVTLAGVLLLLFGRDAVRWHWFALAYLLLMVPIWGVPINKLQAPSQLLSANIAVNLLSSVGVPAYREGTTIMLPLQVLAVLRECSGVNQLIALTAMVLPAAYLWLPTNTRRAALLVFAVAVSYLGNGFRIALVGWLGVKGFGDGDLNGSYHVLQGLGVSALGYLAIGGCFSLLSTSKQAGSPRLDDVTPALPTGVTTRVLRRRVWLDVAVICVLLAASAAQPLSKSLDVQLRDDLGTLSDRIDEWTQEIHPAAPAVPFPAIDDGLVDVGGYPSETGERRFTAVDQELVRAYRSSSGAQVQLYLGYYQRQEHGKEVTGDAGSALQMAASDLTLEIASDAIAVREVVQEKAGTRRGVIFWYDINGRIVPDLYGAKAYTLWDAVTRRRTNAAIVMIAWQGPAGGESKAAREQAIAFARALVPILRRQFPS